MAIGSNYSANNSNQKSTDTTYYSRFKVRSKDGKRSLGINYWSGLMILAINDIDSGSGFKVTDLERIRLSPNKAKILVSELVELKNYIKEAKKIDENKAFGVSAGLGQEINYIAFSALNNEERTIVVNIGKINESGTITSSQAFPLDNDEYLYGLEWLDLNNMNVEKVQYQHMELNAIIDALTDFYLHMNGALAYSVLDLGRYDSARINKKFDSIFDKLGIEKFGGNNGGNYRGGSSNNFLNNLSSNNRSSNSTSFDTLEDMLDD